MLLVRIAFLLVGLFLVALVVGMCMCLPLMRRRSIHASRGPFVYILDRVSVLLGCTCFCILLGLAHNSYNMSFLLFLGDCSFLYVFTLCVSTSDCWVALWHCSLIGVSLFSSLVLIRMVHVFDILHLFFQFFGCGEVWW